MSGLGKIQTDYSENAVLDAGSVLVLYNDDVNTFEHVIECLIDICEHDSIQAQQCAFLVHFTGKTDIKHGEFTTLSECKTALLEKGLSVTIEKSN